MVKPSVLQLKNLPDQGAEPFQQLLQESLQHLLEGQMTQFLGAVPGERTQARTGYRAGHVRRRLDTRAGPLELRVPRDRARRFCTDLLERYPRQESEFISALGEMAAQGLTTRKVSALAEALCGHAFSALALGQIQEGLHSTLARHARGVDSVDVDDGDRGGEAVRESRVRCGSAVGAPSLPGHGTLVLDEPAALAPKAPAPGAREAVAAFDGIAPATRNLDADGFAPRYAGRGRRERWMAQLGGVLLVAGCVLLGMRWMGDVQREPPRAAADFSGEPGPWVGAVHAVQPVHAVNAVHVGRVDGVDLTPVIGRTSPAAPEPAVAPRQRSHFQLTGVVAAYPAHGDGLALIAIDGGFPRVIRVGAIVDGELLLHAVSADRAMLGPAGGRATLVLDLGTSAASQRGVLGAEDGKRSWAGADASAPASDDAKTTQLPVVLVGSMPPPMAVDDDALQPTAVVDLEPAVVSARVQALSHSERRRVRRLNASR